MLYFEGVRVEIIPPPHYYCEEVEEEALGAKIQRLSQEAINQIAAGEVIENPASVVKELVENSLDAGAQEVEVVILSGGQERVRVIDDGLGMSSEDALLSLEPHATSKIGSASDLADVLTMGFRGEALASIASISKLSLETSEGGEGVRLVLNGGKLLTSEPIARAQGTTVTVDELFFNAPVRKGFQRSAAADTGQIRKVVNLLALAHPEVQFTLRQGEEVLLATHRLTGISFLDAFQERAWEVLGGEFCDQALPFEHQSGEIRVRGMVGTPSATRPTRAGQMLLVNRRPVASSLISAAVSEAFSTRLATGRYPVFALHLDLPPNLLDVNVHPQKQTIRLKEESALKGEIIKAIMQALEGEKRIPYPEPEFRNPVVAEEMVAFEPLPIREKIALTEFEEPKLIEEPIHVFGLLGDYFLLQPCGPFAGSKGLLVVDSRRARARVEFERLLKSLERGEVASQSLALPITLELLPDEAEEVSGCQAALHKLGFEVRPFGGNTFLVEALPAPFAEADPKALLERLLPVLKMEGATPVNMYLKGVWKEIAAKEATRSAPRSPLTLAQVAPFVQQWLACKEPIRCPHGKPVCSLLPLDEIERRL